MRILIEASTWWNRRGFGRFTRNLVPALVRHASAHDLTLLVDRDPAPEDDLGDYELLRVDTSRPTHLAATADDNRSLKDMLRCARAVRRGGFDVVFFPAVYSYFPLLPRQKAVVTFHDAIAESLPELVFRRRRNRWFWNLKVKAALTQATRLLAVSESARAQVVEHLGVAAERIDLTTEGPDPAFRWDDVERVSDGVAARHGLPEGARFLLYVGGISPHKNLLPLVRAFARLEGHDDLHLALVGDRDADGFLAGAAEIDAWLAGAPEVAQRVHFTGFVPDEELVALYNRAAAFISPSLAEGFGLCQLEAMTCGAPVLSSDRGSLPEVVGEAGAYFDPRSEDDLLRCLRESLGNRDGLAAMSRRSLERAREFSWDRAASLALASLERAGGVA